MVVGAYALWQRVRNKAFTVGARRAFGRLGPGSSLQLPIRLANPAHIEVGSDVLVFPGAILLSYLGGRIVLGDGSHLHERVTITAQSSVVLGERVMVSRNVHISDHDHRFDDPDVPIMDQGMRPSRPIVIGDGAWIGHGAVVLPGVRIGRNAVVGANAVVTRDVPDRSVAVGQPARVVRTVGEAPLGAAEVEA
jgi:acetyltransferase-like isoleucine patch superfamily enzyme